MKLLFNSKYRTFPAPQKAGFLVSLINQAYHPKGYL